MNARETHERSEPPDGRSTATPTSIFRFTLVLLLVLLTLNGGLLTAARQDQSWGALVIGLLVGPAANGAVLLLALASTLWIRPRSDQRMRFLLAIWLLPILSAAVLAGIVLTMKLRDH